MIYLNTLKKKAGLNTMKLWSQLTLAQASSQ
jgi:hypothetical protein